MNMIVEQYKNNELTLEESITKASTLDTKKKMLSTIYLLREHDFDYFMEHVPDMDIWQTVIATSENMKYLHSDEWQSILKKLKEEKNV